jgi:hypothetical protein
MGESGKATMTSEKQLFYVKYPYNRCKHIHMKVQCLLSTATLKLVATYHDGPHDHGSNDAPRQDTVLIFGGHFEVLKQYHEYEQVVHRQTLFYQVPVE